MNVVAGMQCRQGGMWHVNEYFGVRRTIAPWDRGTFLPYPVPFLIEIDSTGLKYAEGIMFLARHASRRPLFFQS
jgi:hypothetical protein